MNAVAAYIGGGISDSRSNQALVASHGRTSGAGIPSSRCSLGTMSVNIRDFRNRWDTSLFLGFALRLNIGLGFFVTGRRAERVVFFVGHWAGLN